MNDTQSKIGKLIGPDERRDAIHIAVAPVKAGEHLSPGRLVVLDGNGKAMGAPGLGISPIGVVDPFLPQIVVKPGEYFWLFLFPETVTGMRHHWEHPAFDDKPDQDADTIEHLAHGSAIELGEWGEIEAETEHPSAAAELWMRRFAERWGVSYDEALEHGKRRLYDPDHMHIEREMSVHLSVAESAEYWRCFTALTGLEPPPRTDDGLNSPDAPFTCSC